MVEVYNTIGWLWAGAGLSAAAVAVGGFRHGSASRWLAAVSAVLALLVAATQAFPAQYGALFPGALWVIVAGLGLGLRRTARGTARETARGAEGGAMSRDAGTP